MTQELTLSYFLGVLRRYWLLIALVVVVALGAILVLSMLRPPTYQAQALLLVRSPQYQWRFDPSVQPIVDPKRDWRREFMLLAQTQRVAERVAAKMGMTLADPTVLLRRIGLRADAADSIVLEATGATPGAASGLANSWAEVLRTEVSERYGTALVPQIIAGPEGEFAAKLATNQAALEKFKAETGQGVGSTTTLEAAGLEPTQKELNAKAILLSNYQVALDLVTRLAGQVKEAQNGPRAADTIAWELLNNDLLASRPALQTGQRPALSDLAAWETLLQQEAAALQEPVTWFEADVLQLQTQLAAEDSSLYRLTQDRNISAEAFLVGERKLNEIQYQQQLDPIAIDILEQAVPPEAPNAWPLVLRLAVGLVAGLIAGVWLALIWDRLFVRRPALLGAGSAAR